jgi:hypothetical protein
VELFVVLGGLAALLAVDVFVFISVDKTILTQKCESGSRPSTVTSSVAGITVDKMLFGELK